MATLVILKGPDVGRQFPLDGAFALLGRQADATICLESQAVSRHHARILVENEEYFLEDLHSSNGTFVNGKRIRERVPLTPSDVVQIGPYLLGLRNYPAAKLTDTDLVIREQVNADPAHLTALGNDAAHKLQVVLEIAQHLARTLDEATLLGNLLDHLMRLFPQTERGIVLRCEGDKLILRAQRTRDETAAATFPYSRTVVKKVLEDGLGILSEDIRADQRFVSSDTVTKLNMRSLLCVPLLGQNGRRLGVLQLDCTHLARSFRMPDLQLLTAIGLQVSVVLENAALHSEVLKKERLRQELMLAQEIQQGFLPTEFPEPGQHGFELFGRVYPAREMSGDFYDFLNLADGRLAFLIGDVSGKGIPAALFMVAVRTLSRHLAKTADSPADSLRRLNQALAAENPSFMFATLIQGIYNPATGEVVLASGGHPVPVLRRTDGQVETVPVKNGRLVGYEDPVSGRDPGYTDYRFTLEPGETLILYTDGFTEARSPETGKLFGLENVKQAVGGANTALSLEACTEVAKAAVERYTQSTELQDDLTLLLLRRA